MDKPENPKKIEIRPNGAYMVSGGIPLVHKTQVVSEHIEPLTWKKDGDIPTEDPYYLCRCGHSSTFPICDRSHKQIQFDGTETAPIDLTTERQETYPGSQSIVIRMDGLLCTNSGFCANRLTSIGEMADQTGDPSVRGLAMAMVEHCPSGALTYALKEGEEDIEADLPQQIAVTTEITSDGAIRGPLWVSGGIQVMRSDGQFFETRNRVTLCNCGHSQIKPLCDGSHRVYPVKI